MIATKETSKKEVPNCFCEEELWFEFKSDDFRARREQWNFDRQCERALLAKGVNDHTIPTDAGQISLVIVGAISLAFTGKCYIDFNSIAGNDKFDIAWNALWRTTEDHFRQRAIQKEKWQSFEAAMLRNFLPRHYHTPPERPYYESRFEERWNINYIDSMDSIGNLRISLIKQGLNDFKYLPKKIRSLIRKSSTCMQPLLNKSAQQLQL